MNIYLKPLILSTALGTIGLCCTISHAAESFKVQSVAKKIISVNTHGILPSLTGDFISSGDYQKITNFTQLTNQLQRISPSNKSIHFKQELVNKGNTIFQAAMIFNDKLHNFLSNFQSHIPSNYLSSKDVTTKRHALSSCNKKTT